MTASKEEVVFLLSRRDFCGKLVCQVFDTLVCTLDWTSVVGILEQVIEAARQAAIHDVIMRFPDQYETRVGERGLKVTLILT